MGESNLELWGYSGMTQAAKMPKPIVATPVLNDEPLCCLRSDRCHSHDEQPSPTGDTMSSVKFQTARGDKTTQSLTCWSVKGLVATVEDLSSAWNM